MKNMILLLLASVLLSGCATIVRGTTDVISIQSIPSGANVRLSNGISCITPCLLTLPRKTNCSVRFEKEGFKAVDTTITSSISGGGAAGLGGNILIGGIIGIGIDALSGATLDLYPNPLIVIMEIDGTKER